MPRPNVLLIHTDQQRWDALGANGNDEIHTPTLDALAGAGVNFERYFVNAPVCMPSRASYLSGRYPSQLDSYGNGIRFPESVPTLPDFLGPYGYHAANLGKLHFLNHANRDHRAPHPTYGFDQVEISDEPGPYPDAYRAWVRERAPDQLDEISPGLPPATEDWPGETGVEDIHHPEDRFPKRPIEFGADADLTHAAFVADRTVEYLEARAGDRFLCVAGFYGPHSPWIAPREFLDLYDRDDLSVPEFPPELEERREELAAAADDPTDATYSEEELRGAKQGYYAMVSEVDHYVGEILETLDDLGLREETVVIFTSDHGEYLGEHLRYGKGSPGHDHATRVPFLVRWPEGIENPGRTVEDIVEAVDLVPTVLDCAGVQVPPDLQGRSVRPALEDDGFEGRDSALTEHRNGKTLRTDRYRYVMRPDGTESLWDLREDPREYHDLAGDPDADEALADLRARLLRRVVGSDLAAERERDWRY